MGSDCDRPDGPPASVSSGLPRRGHSPPPARFPPSPGPSMDAPGPAPAAESRPARPDPSARNHIDAALPAAGSCLAKPAEPPATDPFLACRLGSRVVSRWRSGSGFAPTRGPGDRTGSTRTCDWIPYPSESCLRHGLSSRSGRAAGRMGCKCDIATLDLGDGGVTTPVRLGDWMSPGSARPEPDINLNPAYPSYRSMPVTRISEV
jgi:hypothetical protein